jgi:V/A-type H+-transporting ATPase subunit A
MSNRLEELPGPDAFPMDLSAVISNFYSRAGFVYLSNGATGSITFIGTVSPAGGNLKEPVTESTRKAARCFYGLSQDRADSKRYPAIDPIDSYSKYLEYPEVQRNLAEKVGDQWLPDVLKAKDILRRGKEAMEQINILGDDSVPMAFHDRYWKSELIDFVILQQDAFDTIDASTPLKRQQYMLRKVLDVADTSFNYSNFEDVSVFFKEVINLFKQMNYSEFESDTFKQHEASLNQLLDQRKN